MACAHEKGEGERKKEKGEGEEKGEGGLVSLFRGEREREREKEKEKEKIVNREQLLYVFHENTSCLTNLFNLSSRSVSLRDPISKLLSRKQRTHNSC